MNKEINQILKNQEVIMRVLFSKEENSKFSQQLGIEITKTMKLKLNYRRLKW